MIKLLKLKFAGIGRFVKEQEIDFSNREKIIQVDGRNLNTGGSSGAAKSTIFHALDYLFGMNEISAKDLQSRVGKTKLSVEGTFEIDGKPVIITRSTSNGLSIKIGEELTSGNVKLAEEKLLQQIGIPEKLFKKMIHKKQKEGGFFLKLTAGEMFKFLIKVLNLEHYTDKILKIDTRITELDKASKTNTTERELLANNLADIEKTLATLVEPVLTFDPKIIEELTAKVVSIQENSSTILVEIQNLQKEQDAAVLLIPIPQRKSSEVDMTGIYALKEALDLLKKEKSKFEAEVAESKRVTQKQINDLNSQVFAIGAARKEMAQTVEKIKNLKAEKTHIESAQCPTCSQTWVGDSATLKLAKLDTEIASLAEKAWNLNNVINDEPRVVEALQVVNDRLKELNTQNSAELDTAITNQTVKISEEQGKIDNYLANIGREYMAEMTSYQNLVMTVKADFTAKIAEAKQRHNNTVSELGIISMQNTGYRSQLDNHNLQIAQYRLSSKNLVQSIDDKKAKLAKLEADAAGLKKSLVVAQETKRLIKNYTLQIFQESLDYIGEQATQILTKIPNMSNASIYFEGCKETAKGTIKDEVNAILNMDGENEINIKTLSGGEETAVELAVDLAVIEMIEHKVGKGADFFILDEPFTGLDSINIQNTMDMLLELNSDKKIIIVDHNPEIKALINDRITVVRNGEESNIEP